MFDPEIPVNIWELGLIYDVVVDAAGVAGVRMTLTAPGCPAAQSLPVEVCRQGQGGARRHRREGRRRLGTGLDEGSDVGGRQTAVGIVVIDMLRLSKKADYALIAMKHLAIRPDAASASAREIAEQYDIPDRADGEGAAAAGAPRAGDVASGHARRLPAGPGRVGHLRCRHHPGDRRTADGHRLLDRGTRTAISTRSAASAIRSGASGSASSRR